MNNKADPAKEVSRRIKECMATLNKLHVYLYNSDNTITRKLQMFNAILRSKVMYGLETIVMNTAVLDRLDVFQLKCLRKILKLLTTYMNREYSNDCIRMTINQKIKDYATTNGKTYKPFMALTEYHKAQRIKYLQLLIVRGEDEPGTAVTFDHHTLQPIDHGKKRIGQPRVNWYIRTLEDLWTETKKNIDSVKFASALKLTNATHVKAIRDFSTRAYEKTLRK